MPVLHQFTGTEALYTDWFPIVEQGFAAAFMELELCKSVPDKLVIGFFRERGALS